jgi:hypothetical protein
MAPLSPPRGPAALSVSGGRVAVTRPEGPERMEAARAMDRQAVRELVTEIFEEEALLLGGIVAVCPIEDEVVWRLVRGLDRLRRRVMQRVDDAAPAAPADHSPGAGAGAEPHPAIERFLREIREEASTEAGGR